MTDQLASDSTEAPLNIVFAGTPEFAARHLAHLIKSHHTIIAVYSQPDRPAGRGKKLSASAVKQLALEHQIPILQPSSLRKSEAQEEFKALNCDVLIVVAYGLILPSAILTTPKHGCINVHGSILPKWRGAAPIQRAIEAGDTQSGVTIMQMDEGLDTGDMLLKVECPILDTDSSVDLHDRLSDIGPPALLRVLDDMAGDKLYPESQDDSQSTYAKKIEKDEAIIDWRESCHVISRKIRAFNPFPVCYGTIQDQRIRIHEASITNASTTLTPGKIVIEQNAMYVGCGDGTISVKRLQVPGKKAVNIRDYLNGALGPLENGQFDLP